MEPSFPQSDPSRLTRIKAKILGARTNETTSITPVYTEEQSDIDYKLSDTIEAIRTALQSRLQPGATAEKLGFEGFEGKRVIDVGTRDGRYASIPDNLGAKAVYGIDPDLAELERAKSTGKLRTKSAIKGRIQDLPKSLIGSFDVAMALNMLIKNPEEREEFVAGIYNALKPGGQIVVTFVEHETYRSMIAILNKYFYFETQAENLWSTADDQPHNILLIGTKR